MEDEKYSLADGLMVPLAVMALPIHFIIHPS